MKEVLDVQILKKITVICDISRFKEKYPHKFIGALPDDVKMVKGKNVHVLKSAWEIH